VSAMGASDDLPVPVVRLAGAGLPAEVQRLPRDPLGETAADASRSAAGELVEDRRHLSTDLVRRREAVPFALRFSVLRGGDEGGALGLGAPQQVRPTSTTSARSR
jgi:hypothetical protein